MAVVTRYFSTTGAGAEDGTTWADRAALFSSGNWSSVITAFDWTSDSLRCLIGPGSYTCNQALNTSATTVSDPSNTNPLILMGCDSSGVALDTNRAWVSDAGDLDTTEFPVISRSANSSIIAFSSAVFASQIKFVGTGHTSTYVVQIPFMDRVWIENQASGASAAGCLGTNLVSNVQVVMTGTSYNYAMNGGGHYFNVRCKGNPSASSGKGVVCAANFYTLFLDRCTIFGHPSDGVAQTVTGTSTYIRLNKSVVANNGGNGVAAFAGITPGQIWEVRESMVTGNGGYGVDPQSTNVIISHSRFRDNTSGAWASALNWDGVGQPSYTTDSDDASEYVDASSGDFRIKASAPIAPMGFGITVAKPTVAG